MNLPFQRIHDPAASYGTLMLPLPFTGRWLALFDKFGLRMTFRGGLHNCTRSGVL